MFITLYTHTRARSLSFGTECKDPHLTEQHHANDCDINVIMARAERTGQLPQITQPAKYGDFSNVPDFRTALDMIKERTDTFHQLPPKLRKRFNNNAVEFVEFVTNPENTEELYTLGLATRPPKDDNPPVNPDNSNKGTT